MKNIYLNNLIKQFNETNGISKLDINDKKLLKEFKDWIAAKGRIYNEFVYFLQTQGIELNSKSCAEVGKGKCDSICLPYESKLITPYVSNLNFNNKNKIMEGKMIVDYCMPVVKSSDAIAYLPGSIRTYFTYNPYDFDDIKNWEKLNNTGVANIIFGILGNNYDKDKSKKMDLLLKLKDKLTGNIKFAYTEYSDIYLGVVASDSNFNSALNYYRDFKQKNYDISHSIDKLINENINSNQKKLKLD